MTPHPRIRKSVKWGGLVAGVAATVVWICSAWAYVGWWSATGTHVIVAKGALSLSWYQVGPSGDPAAGWQAESQHTPSLVWRGFWLRSPASWRLVVPLWPLLVATFLTAATAWRWDVLARRRALAGKCPTCGYDCRGLPARAACPECGSSTAADRAHT